MMRRIVLFILLVLAPEANAYQRYAKNYHLAEELASQPYRILPKSPNYALAIDGDFFKPLFVGEYSMPYYQYDFNHGNGYWIDFRSEFKPSENLILNLKIQMTQGTSSNGPAFESLILPRAAITYRTRALFGLETEAKLGDIDRQTLGNGLFIELKETNGGSVQTEFNEYWKSKLFVDGTGSFRLEGGVVAVDTEYRNGLFGFTGFFQERGTDFNAPLVSGTLYSRYAIMEDLNYDIEAGASEYAMAGMAGLTFNTQLDELYVKLRPQYRFYGDQVLGSLPGRVSHVYVTYDQNDKPYTTLMNAFALGNPEHLTSLLANAEYRFNNFYRVYAESEFIHFRFRNRSNENAIYFRTGFRFFPIRGRDDEFGVLIGNKYLNASTTEFSNPDSDRVSSLPNEPDFENKPLFMRQLFLMANFSVHF